MFFILLNISIFPPGIFPENGIFPIKIAKNVKVWLIKTKLDSDTFGHSHVWHCIMTVRSMMDCIFDKIIK